MPFYCKDNLEIKSSVASCTAFLHWVKMWVFLFLLGSLSMSLGEAVRCEDTVGPCYELRPEKEDFPSSSEDLKNVCSKLIDLNNCLDDGYERCKDDFPREFWIHKDYFPTSLKNITKVCSEGSSVNNALTKHIKCIADTFEASKETCAKVTKDAIHAGGIRLITINGNIYKCAKKLIAYACGVKEIGETCGTQAQSTVYEVTELLKSRNEFCTVWSMTQIDQKREQLGLDEAMLETLKAVLRALEKDETFPIEFV